MSTHSPSYVAKISLGTKNESRNSLVGKLYH